MSNGIVVDHKEHGVRYAVSEKNFNEKIHTKVRDLYPGETVVGFRPRPKGALGGPQDLAGAKGAAGTQEDDQGSGTDDPQGTAQATKTTKTEGTAPAGLTDAK